MGSAAQIVSIAVRNVLRNKRRTAVTLVALAMSVLVLVVVRGVLTGLQENLKRRVARGQTGVVQVHKAGFTSNVRLSPLSFHFPVSNELLARIEAVPGVAGVAPRIPLAAVVSVGDTTAFTLGLGIDPVREYEVCPERSRELGSGERVGPDSAVLTPDLRRALGVTLGAELTLMAPDYEGILNGALTRVGGANQDNPQFSGDKKIILLPLGTAQQLTRLDGEAVELAVGGESIDDADGLKARVSAALGAGYEVSTWRDVAKFAVDALNNQEAAFGFVVVVFTVIGAFGILNTMLMIVLSRTRELGTMMAVGVRRRQILEMILIEAFVLGGLGALLGGSLGSALVVLMHELGLPVKTPNSSVPTIIRPEVAPSFVLWATVLAALIAMLASIYPAWRASKLTPVEALSS